MLRNEGLFLGLSKDISNLKYRKKYSSSYIPLKNIAPASKDVGLFQIRYFLQSTAVTSERYPDILKMQLAIP